MTKRKGNGKAEPIKDKPLSSATVLIYKDRIEAKINGFDNLTKPLLNRAVRALFKAYHIERRRLIHEKNPRTIEDHTPPPEVHQEEKSDAIPSETW